MKWETQSSSHHLRGVLRAFCWANHFLFFLLTYSQTLLSCCRYPLSFFSSPQWHSPLVLDLPRKPSLTEGHYYSNNLLSAYWSPGIRQTMKLHRGANRHSPQERQTRHTITIQRVTKMYYKCSEGRGFCKGEEWRRTWLRSGAQKWLEEVMFTLKSEKEATVASFKVWAFWKEETSYARPCGEKAQLLWGAEERLVELGVYESTLPLGSLPTSTHIPLNTPLDSVIHQ